MRSRGNVEDGNLHLVISKEIEHLGVQRARVQDRSLAGLEPNVCELVAFLRLQKEVGEKFSIVIVLGDPVASSAIEPSHLWLAQESAKVIINRSESGLEILASLFAQRVEMKAADPGEVGIHEMFGWDAEPRAGSAGIIERRFSGGTPWVDPQAIVKLSALVAGMLQGVLTPPLPVSERVKVEMGADLEKFKIRRLLIVGMGEVSKQSGDTRIR